MTAPAEEYVRNAWYVAAWSEEVTGAKPLGRVILGQPLVFFRTSDGEVAAMDDRCAHRAYPLSAGVLTGDTIQCGYHGFEYDKTGSCVRVPGQWRIPPGGRQRTYPVVESHRWIWIWTGDPALADPATVPDTHWMDDAAWDRVTHTRLFECEAGLLHDNLLDLTHETYVHKSTIGDDAVCENGITVEVDGTVVSVDRFMPACYPSPLFSQISGLEVADRWHTTEFRIPSVHIIHAGVTAPGTPREDGYLLEVLNGITPAGPGQAWYFYAFCRNFAVGDQEINTLLTATQADVLDEDATALALQQKMVEGRDPSVSDVLIAQDAGVAKARRIIAQLVAAEKPVATPAISHGGLVG